jgi:hypothetical protein
MEIIVKYFTNVFQRVGTLGAGLVLSSGPFDPSKADKVSNWFKTLNKTQLLETSYEVLCGDNFSNPQSTEDLIEFLIVVL